MTWDLAGLIILGIVGLLAAVAAATRLSRNRWRQRNRRLEQAFRRSRRVSRAGTGEQGRPYSRYTDIVSKPD